METFYSNNKNVVFSDSCTSQKVTRDSYKWNKLLDAIINNNTPCSCCIGKRINTIISHDEKMCKYSAAVVIDFLNN